MDMTGKSQEFEYSHGIAPGLRPRDVLVAWVGAMALVAALTTII